MIYLLLAVLTQTDNVFWADVAEADLDCVEVFVTSVCQYSYPVTENNTSSMKGAPGGTGAKEPCK